MSPRDELVHGYSVGEEVASSVTHGAGVALAAAGVAVLVALAARHGTTRHVVGVAVFGATLILMFLASTLYHSIPHLHAKRVLRVLDHSAIYLVIAGTYTPFGLVTLRGPWGWTLLSIVWTAGVAGIILSALAGHRAGILRVAIYVAMGWVAIVAFKPLAANLGGTGLGLLFGGGLVYTVGIVFYGWRRLPYNHAIWHVFVLVGAALHYFAVLWFVIPWQP